MKYIQQETGTRVQIKGLGSGFVEQETGKESEEPMHIHITYVYPSDFQTDQPTCSKCCSGPEEGQVARAKVLTEDLLEVVRAEHGKAQAALSQQQMELHHAQIQYAQYSAMSVRPSTLTHLGRQLDAQQRLLLCTHRVDMVLRLHLPIMHLHRHRPANNPHHLQVEVHLHLPLGLIPPRTHTLPTGTS